jgi:hypothetical protein
MKRIIKNSIITPDGKELRSYHRHDYVVYFDKNNNYYSVDGGMDYLKRGYDKKNYIENSVYSDGTFELERKYICWGVNYTKDMKKLPKTRWTPIKDLDTDHIYNILQNIKNIDEYYIQLLSEEIIFREDMWYNN